MNSITPTTLALRTSHNSPIPSKSDSLISKTASVFFTALQTVLYYLFSAALSPLYWINPERYYLITSFFKPATTGAKLAGTVTTINPALTSTELQNTIRYGNSADLRSYAPHILNASLPNGELPIHYATREGQTEIIRTMIDLGVNPMKRDYQKLTAVDHALLQNNKEILALLLQQKISTQFNEAISEQNHKATKTAYTEMSSELEDRWLRFDNVFSKAATETSISCFETYTLLGGNLKAKTAKGRTLAHYAALNRNGKMLSYLIQKGADLTAKDAQGVTPLALLGYSALQRDPLNLSRADALMLVVVVLNIIVELSAGTTLYPDLEIISHIGHFLFGGLLGLTAFENILTFALETDPMADNLSHLLLYAQFAGAFDFFTRGKFIGFLSPCWGICNTALYTFEGFKAIWNNYSYQPWKAARNTIVYTLNGPYYIYNNFIRNKSYNKNEHRKENYNEFNSHFPRVDPNALKKLNDINRLNHPKLDPKNIREALWMIDPNFSLEKFRAQGPTSYLAAARNLLLKVHPDKAVGDPKDIHSASVRLNAARETLQQYLKSH